MTGDTVANATTGELTPTPIGTCDTAGMPGPVKQITLTTHPDDSGVPSSLLEADVTVVRCIDCIAAFLLMSIRSQRTS